MQSLIQSSYRCLAQRHQAFHLGIGGIASVATWRMPPASVATATASSTTIFFRPFLMLSWMFWLSPLLAAEHDFYLKSVKPVLQSRCFACHGVLKQEASLRLDTVASMLVGGENGHAIQPNDDTHSLLVQRISAVEDSMRMPPRVNPSCRRRSMQSKRG